MATVNYICFVACRVGWKQGHCDNQYGQLLAK